MTTERRRAVLAMVLTFVIGIIIGAFIPGLVMKLRFGAMQRPPESMSPPKDRFERMIYRIVTPDSSQIEKIRPLAQKTATQIDSIQSNANTEIKGVIDSLKRNLQPILTPDQLKLLENFGDKPRGFGPGRPGGPPHGPGEPGGRGGFPDHPPGSSM